MVIPLGEETVDGRPACCRLWKQHFVAAVGSDEGRAVEVGYASDGSLVGIHITLFSWGHRLSLCLVVVGCPSLLLPGIVPSGAHTLSDAGGLIEVPRSDLTKPK